MFDDVSKKRFKGNGSDEPRSVGHPDAEANVKFWNMQLERVIWNPDREKCPAQYLVSNSRYEKKCENGKWETIDIPMEHIYITFSYPERNHKAIKVVSFHQPNRKFREELCWVLNRMGGLGYLAHKFRNSNGSIRKHEPTASDDPWGQLFD